jgi:hypothetical protein
LFPPGPPEHLLDHLARLKAGYLAEQADELFEVPAGLFQIDNVWEQRGEADERPGGEGYADVLVVIGYGISASFGHEMGDDVP